MLAEIEQFVNWVRRRNPEARTWRDYTLRPRSVRCQLVGDCPPSQVTFRRSTTSSTSRRPRLSAHHHQPPLSGHPVSSTPSCPTKTLPSSARCCPAATT